MECSSVDLPDPFSPAQHDERMTEVHNHGHVEIQVHEDGMSENLQIHGFLDLWMTIPAADAAPRPDRGPMLGSVPGPVKERWSTEPAFRGHPEARVYPSCDKARINTPAAESSGLCFGS